MVEAACGDPDLGANGEATWQTVRGSGQIDLGGQRTVVSCTCFKPPPDIAARDGQPTRHLDPHDGRDGP